MTKIDRLAVNAAIRELIDGTDDWQKSAKIIINACHNLPDSSMFNARLTTPRKSGGKITGYVAGQGNITIDDKRRPKPFKWEYGSPKERIGYYRIWKRYSGRLNIQHFWKAEIGTRSPDDPGPEKYLLDYNPKTLRPIFFGTVIIRTIFQLWFWPGKHLDIQKSCIESLYGKSKQKCSGFGLAAYF